MRETSRLFLRASRAWSSPNLIEIRNATFYRNHPSTTTASLPLFQDLTFSLSAPGRNGGGPEFWAVIGPSSAGKTTLLDVLRGGLICLPSNARRYPHLSRGLLVEGKASSLNPRHAIQYVGFGDANDSLTGRNARGSHLSARYESRRESTDFSLYNYLCGNTSLNPSEDELHMMQDSDLKARVDEVAGLLNLECLLNMPVGNLSNGQTRRARIAKALMQKPQALLLDEPFCRP